MSTKAHYQSKAGIRVSRHVLGVVCLLFES